MSALAYKFTMTYLENGNIEVRYYARGNRKPYRTTYETTLHDAYKSIEEERLEFGAPESEIYEEIPGDGEDKFDLTDIAFEIEHTEAEGTVDVTPPSMMDTLKKALKLSADPDAEPK